MTTALFFLVALGLLGAFDTLFYHEWKLRLPECAAARKELRLHAFRDLVYAIVFGSLGWVTWSGPLVWVLAALLLLEVAITLADFIEEDRIRRLPAGERAMHAVMGITYGVFVALLFPHAREWWRQPAGFIQVQYGPLSWLLSAFAAGVLLSGIRDWRASRLGS